MQRTVYLWRIPEELPAVPADALSGEDVRAQGERWSRPGTPLVYACTSVVMACLENLTQLSRPAERYLVRIAVPQALWLQRVEAPASGVPGWDAVPPGEASQGWGTQWGEAGSSLLAAVPSVVVPGERNVLINPRHPDVARLTATRIRRWHQPPNPRP